MNQRFCRRRASGVLMSSILAVAAGPLGRGVWLSWFRPAGGVFGATPPRGADTPGAAARNPPPSARQWTNSLNWSTDVAPGAADTAVFAPGAAPIAGTVNVSGLPGV